MSDFDWESEVRRTMHPDATAEDYVRGLISEAGELADLLKRSRRENVPLDRALVLEEWGDILWYACALELRPSDNLPARPDGDVRPHLYAVAQVRHAASVMLGDEITGPRDWERYDAEARAVCVAKLRARYPDGFERGVKVGRDEP